MNILIIRSGPYQVDIDSYNLQELGLAAAFIKKGNNCDVMYYHKKKDSNQIVYKNGCKIEVLWRKGIRLLRSGIYPQVLKKDFLANYDAVIVSEYSQIMSHLVAQRHSNVYLYNGPYYNLFKLPFIEPIYDTIFCKKINSEMKTVYCKTQMAAEYIGKKGITNTVVVGVGLDTSKFDTEREILPETQNLLKKMEGKRTLLYVGSIIPRKNIDFLIKAFIELKKKDSYKDVQLVLVGRGDERYISKCKSLISDEIKNEVVWCKIIKNAQLKFVYQKAYAFLLPSIQEIFGMVLLEAMYFGLPVISSHSAGAGTLIQNGINGLIVEQFEVNEWKFAIESILDDYGYASELGEVATETIKRDYMWDSIAKKMMIYMRNCK
ncbi:MAG: glycosyltransferase family 4 protein [Clostridiales bacterium]|nr:glycosyltransferase family 4 protein [Clostridiales bacterium]